MGPHSAAHLDETSLLSSLSDPNHAERDQTLQSLRFPPAQTSFDLIPSKRGLGPSAKNKNKNKKRTQCQRTGSTTGVGGLRLHLFWAHDFIPRPVPAPVVSHLSILVCMTK